MKTEEDEAFDEIARKQGMWGGGFLAKRQMAMDKLQEPVTEHEALKLALEALEESKTNNDSMEFHDRKNKAITAIKAALAQPAQKSWVSLTSEQVQECADNSYYHSAWSSEVDLALFAQNLDAALRKANT